MTAVQTYDPNAARPDAVTMTDAAIAHLQTMLDKRGHGIGLRVSIKATGCSGYGYVVDFVDEAQAGDHIFKLNESLSVFVDDESIDLVKGTQIDYIKQGLNESFVYNNPNQTGECGCGESFTVQK